MIDLFYEGNSIIMGILTLLFLIVLALAVYNATQISSGNIKHVTSFRYRLTYIKSMGIFILVMGILGQLLGLYQAFSAIARAGDISPAVLAGGLKVSMISTLYGVIIFLVSYIIWLGLDYWMRDTNS